MICKKCGSKNFIVYNQETGFRLELIENKLFFVDPLHTNFTYNSRFGFLCLCTSCSQVENDFNIFHYKRIDFKETNFEEIILDLDHTLIHAVDTFFLNEDEKCDFDLDLDRHKYKVFLRPDLEMFINFLNENFKKISIYTASIKEYADKIIPKLNIKNIGEIKYRNSFNLDRSLNWDKEYLKVVNNAIIIDNKPHVVLGTNNCIIKAQPFHYLDKKDNFFQKTIKVLNQKRKYKRIPSTYKLHLEFTCRNLKVISKNVHIKEIFHIIKTEINQEEYLTSYKLRGKNFYEIKKERYQYVFKIKKSDVYIKMHNISYIKYVEIMKLINANVVQENEWQLLYQKEENRI